MTSELDRHMPVVVGPYRVQRLLGKGGMGRVYLAYDARLDRHVALKFLYGIALERRSMVFAEAKALARLNHPSIIQVYDVIDHDGHPILVMEYVEGEDLERRIADRKILPAAAVRIAVSIAAALVESHRLGIIHKDLKLSNVIISESGQAKLADFGVAQLLDEQPDCAVIRTSIAALSPEQISGETVDGRSDLFALGVIIYQMLSGDSPFRVSKNPRDYLKQLLHDSHLPLSVLLPELPPALSTLVDQLLEKSPSLRPTSAFQVQKALENIEMSLVSNQSDTLVVSPPTPGAEYLSEEAGFQKTSAEDRVPLFKSIERRWAALIVFLAVLVGTGVWSYSDLADTQKIVVAVLLPTIKNPDIVSSDELLITSVQQAVTEGLRSISYIRAIPTDGEREMLGDPQKIRQRLSVDEVLVSYLDCQETYCHAALRRYSPAGLLELSDLEIPLNSYRSIYNRVGKASRQLYPKTANN